MSHEEDLARTNIEAYLAQNERKELLRLLTCGNVDDGKSTLIGRLLHDTKGIYEDQLAAVAKDSKVFGTQGGAIDLALLVDGLKSEREQGITIDVAYRYFSTARRKYIIADTPGHEQYTRNMATGASTAELAVILIDARKGVTTQTKRHAFLTSLLGIQKVVVAVNKMDLVGYSREVFEEIRRAYLEFAALLPDRHHWFLPMSALAGDNVVARSAAMPWFEGEPLLELLDTVPIDEASNTVDLRFPVQYVNRPSQDFRGFAGTIASGLVRVGDEVVSLPSGRTSKVSRIVTWEGDIAEAAAPMSVTLTLEDEIDASRGDVLCHPDNRPEISTRVLAMLVWMDERPMVPGREYWVKHGSLRTPGSVTRVVHRVDVNTLERSDAPALGLNEIGRVELRTSRPLLFDAYTKNRATGAFILIDRVTNGTVGAGMIVESGEGHWDDPAQGRLTRTESAVTVEEREKRYGQRPTTVLITGLAGSGKTGVALEVERRLFDLGRAVVSIDGQAMRHGMNRDLGFSAQDRSENLRRSMEVARIMNEAGLICVASLVAPEDAVRRRARDLVGPDRFFLVHLAAPLEWCRKVDRSGIYRDVAAGKIKDVPGIDFPYDPPEDADLVLPSHEMSVAECAERIVRELERRGRIV
ncbi:sulfate adenylyltransferase subunit CysN [Polyangium spumosum]|uniref:Sulfate adenylyltransferase subunit 1 n=1 Tax=Polyangium spumosum TaxID=889282 RepID=A0A6N7PQH6_9BACT|nr:sulfate adenylyltransferase subunit CysN [Polyangium spumosum]MRG94179.1 sulfate adenylyltransferase subunit CysN [Polyangium spumosum]